MSSKSSSLFSTHGSGKSSAFVTASMGGTHAPLEQVGVALHLTHEPIRQIEQAALSKLRHPSAKSDSRDLLAS